MEIVRATSEDAEVLTEITFASKRHWGYSHAMMTQWRDQLTIAPHYIEANTVFIARMDDVIVGYYSLIRLNEETTWLDNLFIQPAFISQGVGRALLRHAREEAKRLGASRIELESEPNAVGIYRRMGAHQIGEKELMPISGQRRVAPILAFNWKASKIL